jgi:hypothetical protein
VAVDVSHVQIHQLLVDLVDRHGRIFPLQERPSRIEIVTEGWVANRIP